MCPRGAPQEELERGVSTRTCREDGRAACGREHAELGSRCSPAQSRAWEDTPSLSGFQRELVLV